MPKCPNCAQPVAEGRKICRNCGGIIEEPADGIVPAVVVTPTPAKEPASGDEPSTPEVDDVAAHEQPTEEARSDTAQEPAAKQSDQQTAWTCPHCGRDVPERFDLCWNCQNPRWSTPTLDPPAAEAITPPRQDQRGPQDIIEASLVDELDVGPGKCPRCGSANTMRGVTVRDEGQGSSGKLKVTVAGNPSALVFKDRLYGELKADICGDCGHVELRVSNPKELYRHYRKSNRV